MRQWLIWPLWLVRVPLVVFLPDSHGLVEIVAGQFVRPLFLRLAVNQLPFDLAQGLQHFLKRGRLGGARFAHEFARSLDSK